MNGTTTPKAPTLDRLDFSIRGASAVAAYLNQTFEMDAETLATITAGVLAQPYRCIDCGRYQPLITIVATGITCPANGGNYGHRVTNDVLQHMLDKTANEVARDYPRKVTEAL